MHLPSSWINSKCQEYSSHTHSDYAAIVTKTISDMASCGPILTMSVYPVSVRIIRPNNQVILNVQSAGPISTPSKYSVNVRLIRPNNQTILNGRSAGPISTPSEY